MFRAFFTAALASMIASACGYEPEEPKVEVEGAWVQVSPVPGRPAAAYFTLRSNNDPTRLVGVDSPSVERIELHKTTSGASMAGMAPLEPDDLNFPPDGVMTFEPGGKHAMLFGLDPKVAAGGKIKLNFRFEPAPAVSVEAEVRNVGQGAPEGHGGH